MQRSIGKLNSSKHLLDEVGASDVSNRGKLVSWKQSSACERSIGNAYVQNKKKEIVSPSPVNTAS